MSWGQRATVPILFGRWVYYIADAAAGIACGNPAIWISGARRPMTVYRNHNRCMACNGCDGDASFLQPTSPHK
jgi:hypothetical protein